MSSRTSAGVKSLLKTSVTRRFLAEHPLPASWVFIQHSAIPRLMWAHSELQCPGSLSHMRMISSDTMGPSR
jgi:hypothetical protein